MEYTFVAENTREKVIEALQVKLDVLKKNRENVSEELLTTKYAASYKKLKAEIVEAYNEMANREFRAIHVEISKRDDLQELWDSMYKRRVSNSIYKEYDAQKTMSILEEFVTDVMLTFSEYIA